MYIYMRPLSTEFVCGVACQSISEEVYLTYDLLLRKPVFCQVTSIHSYQLFVLYLSVLTGDTYLLLSF